MTTFADMAKRAKAAFAKGAIVEDAILSTDIELIEVNQNNLLRGLNALGVKITPAYKNDAYARRKQQKNSLPPYGTPDLYRTGSFHEKIEFHIQGRRLVWEDSDSKAPDLLKKYGSVLGVSENDLLIKYRKTVLLPVLLRDYKRKTGMK